MSNTESGYIKLFRSLIDWEWYDDTPTVRVWIHLLLKANHKDQRWRGVEIKRGQLITSTATLAQDLRLTIQQIRRAIRNLQKSGEITIKTTNKYTLITVEKYTFFQDGQNKKNKQENKQTTSNRTNEEQTENKQRTTNKNEKNEKNEKNILPRKRGGYRSSSFEEELDAIIKGEQDE